MTLNERFEDFECVKLSSLWSMVEFTEQLEARFGPQERLEYCIWEIDQARQERTQARTPTMFRNELLHTIDTMNYKDESSRVTLVTAMYRKISPWIPIGRLRMAISTALFLIPMPSCLTGETHWRALSCFGRISWR